MTVHEQADGYRLPTEAEWEYAARGGRNSKGYQYAGSNDLNEVGWHEANAGSKTHPVGEKTPNELGIHDTSGNVYEWCWDWFASDYYKQSPEENPKGPDKGSVRVGRGGGWFFSSRFCRVDARIHWGPTARYDRVGFRLARSLEAGRSGARVERKKSLITHENPHTDLRKHLPSVQPVGNGQQNIQEGQLTGRFFNGQDRSRWTIDSPVFWLRLLPPSGVAESLA